MKPYEFSNANLTLVKPQSMTDEECRSITAYKGVDESGYPYIEVGYSPTQKDIEALVAGRPVHFRVMGSSFAPIIVYTTDEHGNMNPEEEEEEKETICPLTEVPCSCPSNAQCDILMKDDEEVKHICPTPESETPCDDCPPQGCYHPESTRSCCDSDCNGNCNR